LRTELLKLTGAIPLLPDYAMGTWFTWYHNYTAASKLAEIKQWHGLGVPLDVAGAHAMPKWVRCAGSALAVCSLQ